MDLSKQMAPIHIRAFAELAGEVFSVPDPLSLVSRMSCANFIMRQWTSCIFHEDPLSIDGSDELHGTFWIKEGNTSKSTTLNIVYDLTSHWNKEIWTELRLTKNHAQHLEMINAHQYMVPELTFLGTQSKVTRSSSISQDCNLYSLS